MPKQRKVTGVRFVLILLPVLISLTIALESALPLQLSPERPQVDPFYLRLFDEGRQAFNQGDFEEAFQSLKIAAFGFLDEPDFLGETFVYLTLCAYNLKNPEQVEYYLKEMSRFKLNDRISGFRLPKEIKDLYAKIQAEFKDKVSG